MKPLGMTSNFQITNPTTAQNVIYDAVETAIRAGYIPTTFFNEVWDCWNIVHKEMNEQANKEFEAMRSKL